MRLPLPLRLDHVNTYALDDGDSWTLIDTGFDTKKTRAVWHELLQGPLAGKPVKKLFVTHYHPDHIGLAGWFQTNFGVELITTRTSWLTARMLVLDEQSKATPETLLFYKRAGVIGSLYEKKKKERPFNFCDVVSPMPQGYTRVQEGESITLGGRDWIIRMGNGHAAEHATLWAGDIVLGGDQLLPSISPNLGVYATEPGANPVFEWLEACKRLKKYASSSQLVLPGHKLPFRGLPLRLEQLIENHVGALKRLLSHLEIPRTAHECFLPLFKREIDESEYGLALGETIAHLNYLYSADQVTRTIRFDGAYEYKSKIIL
jgi:glyoxylase-like metal-dependent hydrolase (beta-lactamase superfamily II)